MRCDKCGVEGWLKTCRRRDDPERRGVLCDPCFEPLAHLLWIVPGHVNVASKCSGCGRYVHPSEIDPATAIVAGHSKRDVVSVGTCRMCAEQEGGG